MKRKLCVVDVDLSRFFDTISARSDAGEDCEASAGRRGAGTAQAVSCAHWRTRDPTGFTVVTSTCESRAESDLDHALDRGKALLTYVRYLDDMVVLAPDSPRGRAWSDRALERIREEAGSIGVSLNMEKTRTVTMTDRDARYVCDLCESIESENRLSEPDDGRGPSTSPCNACSSRPRGQRSCSFVIRAQRLDRDRSHSTAPGCLDLVGSELRAARGPADQRRPTRVGLRVART